jgi:hypothetical protein
MFAPAAHSSAMKSTQPIDVLEAAVYAFVTERYRRSYLHDIQGDLQGIYGGVELLVRAADGRAANASLAEKAAALVKRALQNHEKMLINLVNQVAPGSEQPVVVNMGDLTADVLRFVRSDFASKFVTFRFESAPDVVVLSQAGRLRNLILGLSAAAADELAPDSVVEVDVSRSESHAKLEFRSMKSYRASAKGLEDAWHAGGPASRPDELVLALTQRWMSEIGGRVELTGDGLPSTLRVFYPLASSDAGNS